jgi:hypothetical protein
MMTPPLLPSLLRPPCVQLWIMLPSESYQMIWMTAIVVVAVLLVGVKLQSVVISLAEDAFRLYACNSGALGPSVPAAAGYACWLAGLHRSLWVPSQPQVPPSSFLLQCTDARRACYKA